MYCPPNQSAGNGPPAAKTPPRYPRRKIAARTVGKTCAAPDGNS